MIHSDENNENNVKIIRLVVIKLVHHHYNFKKLYAWRGDHTDFLVCVT